MAILTIVDHVNCEACGSVYTAERRGTFAPVICGACGSDDERLVFITSRVVEVLA